MAVPRPSLPAAAWGVTAPLAGLAAARLVGEDRHPVLAVANAATPFAYLPAWGAAAVGLRHRRPALVAAAGTVALAHAVWAAPELRRGRPVPAEARGWPRIRVATCNVRFPSRNSVPLGEELAAAEPDVLLFQELSAEHVAMVKSTGAFDRYPWSYVDPRPGSFGAGIWSRWPLSEGETWAPGGLPMVRAVIDVEGTPVRVFDVHCKAPMRRRWIPIWKEQLADVAEAVRSSPWPAIVAGDFNSTYGHAPFRRLLSDAGLRSAHVEAGRGLATTWPRGGRVMPALFRLDHVLVTDGLTVLEVREGRGTGSDHRPVIADLAVEPGGAGRWRQPSPR
ncbi:MAG: endonuclease/exonuclease/phosphatase family protein [Acidimicrobiia bacterium]